MRANFATVALAATAALSPGAVFGTTREIAEQQQLPLTVRRSVLNQLTHDAFWDPYDELERRPFNLLYTNNARQGYLSPWPGQQGEHDNYLDALIGNNGANNVRDDSDALSGAYIRRPGTAWPGVCRPRCSPTTAAARTA